MENEIVVKVGLFIILTLVVWIILDGACLKKHRAIAIVNNKRFESGMTGDAWGGFSFYQDYIIDFELDGKEHSVCVSSDFYKTLEKGRIISLEYRISRFAKSMIVEVLEDNN